MNPFASGGMFDGLLQSRLTGSNVDAARGLTLNFGAWSIATHLAGWRVLREAELVAGRLDPRTPEACTAAIEAVPKGRLLGFEPASTFDVRLHLENAVLVEIFVLQPGPAEICAIMGPGHLYAEWMTGGDWRIGRSGN